MGGWWAAENSSRENFGFNFSCFKEPLLEKDHCFGEYARRNLNQYVLSLKSGWYIDHFVLENFSVGGRIE